MTKVHSGQQSSFCSGVEKPGSALLRSTSLEKDKVSSRILDVIREKSSAVPGNNASSRLLEVEVEESVTVRERDKDKQNECCCTTRPYSNNAHCGYCPLYDVRKVLCRSSAKNEDKCGCSTCKRPVVTQCVTYPLCGKDCCKGTTNTRD